MTTADAAARRLPTVTVGPATATLEADGIVHLVLEGRHWELQEVQDLESTVARWERELGGLKGVLIDMSRARGMSKDARLAGNRIADDRKRRTAMYGRNAIARASANFFIGLRNRREYARFFATEAQAREWLARP